MVESFLEIKDALLDTAHPDVCLSETQWNNVEELAFLQHHSFLFTKKLQTADLTPGAFFKEWKKLLLSINRWVVI